MMMSSYLIVLSILLITTHRLSCYNNPRLNRVSSVNTTCITIPLSALSSRNDDKFSQLKFFALPHSTINQSQPCIKFILRSTHSVYSKSINQILDSFCMILQAHPMFLFYLNDHRNENHASPSAHLFFLKFFTSLNYPMLVSHFFRPFHPMNYPKLNFFQLAPTYRDEARALISLMKRYDWNTFSLIIDPQLPGEDELLDEFAEHSNEQRACRKTYCNRKNLKRENKITILSIIRIRSANPIQIKYHLSKMNPETRVIIVHATSTLASIIVKQANNLTLTGPEYMWIMSTIVLSTYSGENEPKVSPYDNPNRRKMEFFRGTLALYNDATRDTLLARFDKHIAPLLINVFHKVTHLDVIQQWQSNLTVLKRISNQPICGRIFSNNRSPDQAQFSHSYPNLYNLFKDEFKQAFGVFQQDGFVVSANYSILNYQLPNREWKKVGEYINNTLSIADIQWPGDRSKPPPGKPVIYYLKVVILEEPPFVILKDPSTDGKCQTGSVICRIGPENSGANHSDPQYFQCCSGFYIDVFNILKERLQFQFELYRVPDRTWGARNPVTNKWNGLVAEAVENRADLILTALKVTTERNAAIDFTVPLMETGIGVIVSLRPGAVSTTAFLKPYDYRIWILILLVTLHGIAVVVFLFEYFQKRLTCDDIRQKIKSGEIQYVTPIQYIRDLFRPSRKRDLNITFFQSVWLSWVILFRAPAKVNHPKGFTSKFMANIWACFCLAFTASYTANLAAFMITKEVYFDLSGVNDMRFSNPHSMKPSFRFGTIANGSTDEVMKTNHKQVYSYMKQFMKKNIDEGIKALKADQLHAFIYDAVVLDYLSGQDDGCKLRVVGNWYAMTGYGIGLPKQSKFKDVIDKELIELHHSGVIERLRKSWFTGACKSSMSHQSQSSSPQLGILNFISAFLLLFAGTLIAVIILFCENIYSRFIIQTKRMKKPNDQEQDDPVYEPMLIPTCDQEHTPRERILEMRIESLQERIRELETRSSYLVLPVTYTSTRDLSPKLEIISRTLNDSSKTSLMLVEKAPNSHTYETVV